MCYLPMEAIWVKSGYSISENWEGTEYQFEKEETETETPRRCHNSNLCKKMNNRILYKEVTEKCYIT